jgi:hypothetical protein
MNELWTNDVQDVSGLVRAMYACISGSAGAPRDWERFRYLMHPKARLLRTVVEANGRTHAALFDADSYIADAQAHLAHQDFYEIEIASRIECFGKIAHVWSMYEARPSPGASVLLKRGANSIQLCHEHDRWWMFSMIWDNERDGVNFGLIR